MMMIIIIIILMMMMVVVVVLVVAYMSFDCFCICAPFMEECLTFNIIWVMYVSK